MSPEEFTVADGLAWLGISEDDYRRADEMTRGVHSHPIVSALLDARAAQGTPTTPAEVLARYDIDPADPLQTVRRHVQRRSKTWEAG